MKIVKPRGVVTGGVLSSWINPSVVITIANRHCGVCVCVYIASIHITSHLAGNLGQRQSSVNNLRVSRQRWPKGPSPLRKKGGRRGNHVAVT